MRNPTLSEFTSTGTFIEDVRAHSEHYADQYDECQPGWLYWDDRLFIEKLGNTKFNVELFGDEFTGSHFDCIAELWSAAIGESVLNDHFSKDWQGNPTVTFSKGAQQ